jgi:phosphate uptake regulator
MEYRKLIKFGKNSYVVSVPKSWLKNNKLKKGDTLYVSENNNTLSLSSKNNEKKDFKKITIDTNKKSLKRIQTEIVSSYLNNYNEIHLEGENVKDNALKIKEYLNELAGIEVIEQTKNKIIAKDLLDKESISLSKLVRRIDMIIRGMLDDSISTVKEDNYDSIFQRDKDVNRLVYLSERILRSCLDSPCQIREEENVDNLKVIMIFELVITLERIGDQAKRIARYARKLRNEKMRLEFEKIYKDIKKLYLDLMKAYYTGDKELSHEIDEHGISLIEQCNQFLKKYPGMKKAMIMDYMKRMISTIRQSAMAIINYDKQVNE